MITERVLKGQLKPSVTDAGDIVRIIKHQDSDYHDHWKGIKESVETFSDRGRRHSMDHNMKDSDYQDHWKVIKGSVETFSDGCRRHTKDYSDNYDHWKGIYGYFFFVMSEWQIFFLALRFNRFNLNNVFPANATESLWIYVYDPTYLPMFSFSIFQNLWKCPFKSKGMAVLCSFLW